MAFIDCNAEKVKKIEGDVCIVGTGAVGLSMALSFLKDSSLKVILVESGGQENTAESLSLNKMEYTGVELENPPDLSRMRMLGGSTNCWGGWCRPISERVFKKWPISRDEMMRFRNEADAILQLKPGSFDHLKPWYLKENQKDLSLGDELECGIRQVKDIRLWPEYKDRVISAKNIETLYNLSAYNIVTDNESGEIKELIGKNFKGEETKVKAKKFVLAAGGLENPILMQNMDLLNNGFFSKRTSAIGKYYSDHCETPFRYYPLSSFVPKFKDFNFNRNGKRFYHWVRMDLSLNTKRYPEFIDTPHAMATSFYSQFYLDIDKGVEPVKLKSSKEENLIKRYCMDKNEPLLKRADGILLYASQASVNNRIELSDKKNSLGHYKGKMFFSVSNDEILHFKKLATQLDKSMRRTGLARMNIGERLSNGPYTNFEKKQIHNGRHHMGGTRMSIKPDVGVVDTNLKVHGVKNLYIAGPGVFPHFDWHGPTYSSVMLGLRLKHHLVKELS